MRYRLGWQRELPDHRDWLIDQHPEARGFFYGRALFSGASPSGSSFRQTRAPPSVDLTPWCSPIEDQGALGSCTSQAAVGCVEYIERRALGRHVDASRLFVYKTTRNLLGWTGDTGAYVRTTLKALATFGAPPEKYWPHVLERFDDEPPPFVYAFGRRYRTVRYFRLDHAGRSPAELLSLLRVVLGIALPVVFGFTVYDWANADGEFTMPGRNDRPQGGHAVLAVGYDDGRTIGESTGAIKIRNSWGTGWGEQGYGWLPYDYLTAGLASDFWTIFHQDYVV